MMGGIKAEGGGMVVIDEDGGDGMQCSEHPYRNNPGGICAFCLQEKLGKLVSSSFPLPVRGSSSSSSSPSFRSDVGTTGSTGVGGSNVGGHVGTVTSLSLAVRSASAKVGNDGGCDSHYQDYHNRRSKIPFLLAKKKKKMMVASSSTSATTLDRDIIVFKRSKSTATAPGGRRSKRFLGTASAVDGDRDFSPRRRGGFWSFLYHSSSKPKADKVSSLATTNNNGSSSLAVVKPGGEQKCLGSSSNNLNVVVEDDNGIDDMSPNSQATASASSLESKVSRSRSVGCGSRSFSGDFFERISTGFGDCTLRRVESQREGKPKVQIHPGANMKERVRCGGIFGGFIITSSSSSSSSSSYWVSSSAEEITGKSTAGSLPHGRTRNWGWAFASPMRAFTKPSSSKDGKRDHKNTTTNLAAIPSLLAVRG